PFTEVQLKVGLTFILLALSLGEIKVGDDKVFDETMGLILLYIPSFVPTYKYPSLSIENL
ncbi:MAG: hypothetical protein ACYC5G_04835, partial [Candidatus Doudnabacteria bacterium]